ncbi:MAG: hypothetical protein FWE20_09400 [Defluviitaleaceae bacterium]|nr:hypothetical protein [Defluviitaleaceae bacterium]
MLIDLMSFLGVVYFVAWFVWPFVFVISCMLAIQAFVKDDGRPTGKPVFWASFSLMVILSGIISPHLHH